MGSARGFLGRAYLEETHPIRSLLERVRASGRARRRGGRVGRRLRRARRRTRSRGGAARAEPAGRHAARRIRRPHPRRRRIPSRLAAGGRLARRPAGGAPVEPWQPRTVLVQVVSTDEARAAVARGADGIVAKGSESGGRVGDEGTFVLLQRLVSELDVPIWAQGGIGLHTAPACIAGGAAGVVLDAQLALVSESTLPDDVRAAVRAMDGSETRLVRGHRLYTRPDLSLAEDDVPARLGADGLATHVLPAGQDAAFAGPLAERFETTAGVVRAVKAAMGENPRRARALQPLAPGSALARAHGIRYPLAQGPMT